MRKQGEYIIDKRLKFKKGFQKRFIREIKKKSGLTWRGLAEELNISEHTLRVDWQKEKTTIPYKIAGRLINKYPFGNRNIIFVKWIKEILPERWGQILAGGINKKQIRVPKKSEELAELFGVILGDGHLERKTLTITGNIYEKEYHLYLIKEIEKLFGIDSKVVSIKDRHTNILKTHSTELIGFLVNNGMSLGNKIKNKSSLPDWIFEKKEFMFGALRGLFDTDGGIYLKQKMYKRAIIEFQTKSPYIRENIYRMLKKVEFCASKSSSNVRIQNQEEVYKFLRLIGSSNPKNIIRTKHFIKDKFIPKKEKLTKEIISFKGDIPFKMRL